MKRNNIIILSAAVLLALIGLAIVIVRRRGRKVYLKDKYRLNSAYRIWIVPDVGDYDRGKYFDGILDYVVIAPNAPTLTNDDGGGMVAVKAVGIQFSDSVRRFNLDGTYYIETKYLDI